MLRRHHTASLTVGALAALTLAVPALAQDFSSAGVDLRFDPPRPAKGTTFLVAVDGTRLDQTNAKIPSSVRVDSPAGLTFDAASVPTTCSAEQASQHACPAESQVAAGTAVVTVRFGPFSSDVSATLTAYLAPASQPGDLAGLVVEGSATNQKISLTGRVLPATASAGPALLFNVGGGGLPSGVSGQLKTLALQARASRSQVVTTTRNKKVKKTVTVKGKKVKRTVTKKVKVKKTVVHNLLTTPKTCPGAWTAGVTVGYADGSSAVVPASIPCNKT